MSAKVLSIAANTIREGRRHKVFYSIVFFGLVVVLNSFVFTNLSIGKLDRILRDVGMTAIDFFGVLLAIFLGIGMVSREVDRKTVYTVITKPVRRAEFVLGKFLGLSGILIVTLGLMFVSFLGVLMVFSTFEQPNYGTLIWSFVLRLVELEILVAFAILMSTFSGTIISAFSSVALYVIGHLSSDLYFFGARSASAVVRAVSSGLYYALPNLERFNVSKQLTYNESVDAGLSSASMGYGALYVAAFLIAGALIFERRDLK